MEGPVKKCWSICRGAMSNPLYSSMEFANVGLGMNMMGETQHRSSARRSVVKPAEVMAPELLSTMRHMQLAHAMPSTSNYCVPVVSTAKLAICSPLDLLSKQFHHRHHLKSQSLCRLCDVSSHCTAALHHH